MSKIKEAFKNKKVIIAYLTIGDFGLDTTKSVIKSLIDNEVDIIELGIPFSDPTAEHPIIQESNIRALKNDITTDKVFDFVKEIRNNTNIPIIFKTYANVVFSYGTEKFMAKCKEIKIDGLFIPEIPYEEKDEFLPMCNKYCIELISLVAPTSDDRIAMISNEAQGFLYVVPEVNFAFDEQTYKSLEKITNIIHSNTDVPCAIDFDISNPDYTKKLLTISDGIIIGSSIVKIISEHKDNAISYINKFVQSINALI